MSRFVDVRGRYINADLVRSFWQTKDGSLHVELTEDEQEIVPGTQAGYTMSQLMGENYIVQVIPTVALTGSTRPGVKHSAGHTPQYFL